MNDSKTFSVFLPRGALALAAALLAVQANATLLLDTSITAVLGDTSTDTGGNDLPGAPGEVYFGQLQATAAGSVDFFYIGNEAGYTNSLMLGGAVAHSAGPDSFASPYSSIGSLDVGIGELLDFGFCTSGGVTVGAYGRCASNNDGDSLAAQYSSDGYRSIAFAALMDFDSSVYNSWAYPALLDGPTSDLWMILWDDSGAQNDDNHDDYVAIAQFRPVQVPEPSTLMLLGAGLLGLGLARRHRRR